MFKFSLPLIVVYVMLLLVSHGVRWLALDEVGISSGTKRISIPETVHGRESGRKIRVAYQDWNVAGQGAPILVLLHGSPGDANT